VGALNDLARVFSLDAPPHPGPYPDDWLGSNRRGDRGKSQSTGGVIRQARRDADRLGTRTTLGK
jgi:hypothetical protein